MRLRPLGMDSTLRCFDARPWRPLSIMSRQQQNVATRVAAVNVNAPVAPAGKESEALQSYFRMREVGSKPSAGLVVDALKACSSLRDLQAGGRIHSDVLLSGELKNSEIGSTLVDMYAKCGNMTEARKVFDELQQPDAVSWDALIMGYAYHGESSLALEAFLKMRDGGQVPTRFSLLGAVMACTGLATRAPGTLVKGKVVKLDVLEKGKLVHSEVTKSGYETDVSVGNALVEMYSRCGSMEDAQLLFDRLQQRDIASWNALILGYAYNGQGQDALRVFETMQSKPNSVTFVAALRACCSMAEQEAGKIVGKRLVKSASVEKGRAVHASAAKAGFELDLYVANTLIEMYARCGHIVEARSVFEKMTNRDVLTWNSMITAHGQHGELDHALRVYKRMQDSNCAPNIGTYVLTLKACITGSSLEGGKQIHADMRKAGLDSNEYLKSCLVELYSKCGNLPEAQQLFDSMTPKPSLAAWNALIGGYGMQGEGNRAVELFEKLRETQLPDSETFLSVLTACSQTGLADKGKAYFESMKTVYGITPTKAHYTCMVDILGQAEKLEEALELIKSMPTKAEGVMWMSLLSVCRQWKNVAVGKQAFEALMEMDSNNTDAKEMMAHIYSASGMDAEAEKLSPKSSLVASTTPRKSKGPVIKHKQAAEIAAKLQELSAKMPPEHNFYNFDDDSSCGHSERLALGCALINTKPGTSLRIVKNLRICEECHKFYAFASEIENRAIVCRDANRFHNFKDGKCSCNDFW